MKEEKLFKRTVRRNYFQLLNVFKPFHRRKKVPVPAAFWQLFKNATFEFSKYESFVTFIMPEHSSDGNFRPFCDFIDFLQMFKVGKFAS